MNKVLDSCQSCGGENCELRKCPVCGNQECPQCIEECEMEADGE
jgi:hypothetical protein